MCDAGCRALFNDASQPETIMTTSSFDAVKVAERLQDAGVPAGQAREHALLLCEVLHEAVHSRDEFLAENFVTRQEFIFEIGELKVALAKLDAKVDAVAAVLEAKIAVLAANVASLESRFADFEPHLDTKIKAAIAGLKTELILWVVSVGILQSALITGLVLKIVH